jgi:hypothetical protein
MIALIVPEPLHSEAKDWPDFASRVEKLFGNRRLPGADLLIEERGRFQTSTQMAPVSLSRDPNFCSGK